MVRRTFNSSLFVDRPDLLKRFTNAIDLAATDRPNGVLYYGEGGSGKTWLFHRLIEKIRREMRDHDKSVSITQQATGYLFGFLSLDRTERDPWRWLLALRDSFKINRGTMPPITKTEFPRFDALSVHYARHLGEEFEHRGGKVSGFIDGKLGDALDLGGGFLTEQQVIPFARVIKQGLQINAVRRDTKRFEELFSGYEYWSRDVFLEQLPKCLALDINDIHEKYPNNKLVLLIDSHDRLLTNRSRGEAQLLEDIIRKTIGQIRGGTVCLFSQYSVPWFTGVLQKPQPQMESAGLNSSAKGTVDELDVLLAEADRLEPELGRENEAFAERSVDHVRLEEFTPQMTRAFLAQRGFEGELDEPFCQAIIESTTLPFEIEEKALLIKQSPRSSETDRERLVRRLRQPFNDFFREMMEAKPHDDVVLISLLWQMKAFSRDTLASLCKLLNVDDVADRVLTHGMIEEVPGGRRQWYRLDEHYLKHLQLYWLEQRAGQLSAAIAARPNAVALAREFLWKDARHAPSLKKLFKAFESQTVTDYCNSLALMAQSLQILREDLGTVQALSEHERDWLIVGRQELLFGSIGAEDDGAVERLIGGWSPEIVNSILQDAVEEFAVLSVNRSSRDLVQRIGEFEQRLRLALKRNDRFGSIFLAKGIRAVELMVNVYSRWGSAGDPTEARSRIDHWIEAIQQPPEKGFLVDRADDWSSTYWRLRLECFFQMSYPLLRARGATRRDAHRFGASKTRFLRALEALHAHIQGHSQLVLQEKHHKIAALRFHLYEATAKRTDLNKSNRASYAGVISEARELAQEFESDPEVLSILASVYLEIDPSSLSKDDLGTMCSELQGLLQTSGKNLEVLYVLEKASVNHARRLLAEGEPELSNGLAVLQVTHDLLFDEIRSVETPSPELAKLFLKNLRKSVAEGWEPRNVAEIGDALAKIFRSLENAPVSAVESFTHETTLLTSRRSDFASSIIASVSEICDGMRNEPVVGGDLQLDLLYLQRSVVWNYLRARLLQSIEKQAREDIVGALRSTCESADALFGRNDVVGERYKRMRNGSLSELLRQLQAIIREGQDEWTSLSHFYFTYSRVARMYPFKVLKSIVGLAIEYLPRDGWRSAEVLEVLEVEAREKMPTDLRWFAALAKVRNEIDGRLSSEEKSARSEAIASIRELPALTSPEADDERTTTAETAEIAAASALAYRALMGHDPSTLDRVRRVLAEAVIIADRMLPADNMHRQRLRTAFGEAVWGAMQWNFDRNRQVLPTTPVIAEGAFDAFAVGDNESFFKDLLAAVASLSPPLDLFPRDWAIMFADSYTARLADNGAAQDPGPLTLGSWGKHRIHIPSNLVSPLHFLQFGAGESPERANDDRGDQYEEEESESVTQAAALAGGSLPLFEPGPRLVAIIEKQRNAFTATERGDEYVGQMLSLFFPGMFDQGEPRARMIVGASRSLVIAVVPGTTKTAILRSGGWFPRALEQQLGLRRLAIMQSSRSVGAGALEDEIREFLSTIYDDLALIEFNGSMARLAKRTEAATDFRKDRTFEAAFQKCFPGLELSIVDKDHWWRRNIGEESADFEGSIEAGDDGLVDGAAEFIEERNVVVDRVYRNQAQGVYKVRALDHRAREIFFRQDVLQDSGFYFVAGQKLICNVKLGPKSSLIATSVRLYEPRDDQLVDVLVTDTPKGTFDALIVGANGGKEASTCSGAIGLARRAGYHSSLRNTVLRCEVVVSGVETKVVYIKPLSASAPLQLRVDCTIVRFDNARGAYLLHSPNHPNFKIYLSWKLVETAGYAALTEGDQVGVDIVRYGSNAKARRLVSCERKILRDVRGFVGEPRKHPTKGWLWPFTPIGAGGGSTFDKTRPLILSQSTHEAISADGMPPRGMIAIVDLQEDSNGWRVAARARPEFVEGHRWQLGRLRTAKTTVGSTLSFLRLENGEDAFVPPSLRGDLEEGWEGTWFEAKLVICRVGAQEKPTVLRIRRPQTHEYLPARATRFDFRDQRITIRSDDSDQEIIVSKSTFDRARLSTVEVRRMPLLCDLRNIRGTATLVDLHFDRKRGWDRELCFLRPYSADDASRTLSAMEGRASVTLHENDPMLKEIGSAVAGSVFAVDGFRAPNGEWRAVHIDRELDRVPWRYGFISRADRFNIEVAQFGGASITIPRHIVAKRDGRDPLIGGIVRFTDRPDPLGMFEYQDVLEPWSFAASVVWFDGSNDYGKVALILDDSIDIRFSTRSLTRCDVTGWAKGLPIALGIERMKTIRNNKTGALEWRAVPLTAASILISDLPWKQVIVKELFSHGSAILEIEDEDSPSREAYAPAHHAMAHEGSAPIAVGRKYLAQLVPGLKGRSTIVNLAWLPPNPISETCQLATCKKIDYRQQTAEFNLIRSGETIEASARMFAQIEGEESKPKRGDVALIEVELRRGELVATAVLERLGRVMRTPYVPEEQEQPREEAAESFEVREAG
jgi:hypothetical protein